MRVVIWTARASRDFNSQLEYIARDSSQNAELMRERVLATATHLAEFSTGRPGRVLGTYEAVVPKTSLILAYKLGGNDMLQILRLIHGARDWRPGKWPMETG